jgi:hypothetical protein
MRRLVSAALDAVQSDEARGLWRRLRGRAPRAENARMDDAAGPEQARFLRALSLLRDGRLAEGFAEYESRFSIVPPANLPVPLWRGEDLKGKSLLVHPEQGYGDLFQFVRYLPMLARRGARVVLTVYEDTLRLLKETGGADSVVALNATIPAPDFHAPLLSLPHRFGTTLETIPTAVPYLEAPADLSTKLRRRPGTRLAIGIAWAGQPSHGNDGNRSMPLSLLAALAEIPGVEVYSLQVGDHRRDLEGETRIAGDLGDILTDWARIAAALKTFDLLVSVDTAVVHLAGALARPCYVLLPHVADWRWLKEREESPWYPTLRLFRQESPGDWAGVMRRVRAAVERLAK